MPAGDAVAKQNPKHSLRALLGRGDAIKRRATKIAEDHLHGPEGPLQRSADAVNPPIGDGVSDRGEDKTKPPAESAPSNGIDAIPPTEPKTKLREFDNEVNAVESSFKTVLRNYESEAKPKFKLNINPDEPHSMEELLKVVEEAAKKHQQREDKRDIWGRIRHAFRKLGEAGEAIQGWLGLLPIESEYFSVVCGGLTLIIGVAARLKEISDSILEGLEQIPTILNSARRVLNLFKDSETLETQSKALYKAILEALGHMLEYIRKKTIRKNILEGTVALIAQTSFKSGMMERVSAVATERDLFNEEAELCHKEAVHKHQEEVQTRHKAEGKVNEELTSFMEEATKERERSLAASKEHNDMLKSMDKKLDSHSRNQKARDKRLETKLDKLLKLLQDNPRLQELARQDCLPFDSDEDMLEPRLTRRETVISVFRGKRKAQATPRYRQQLLNRLDYDADIIETDLKTAFAAAPRLDMKDQDRVVYTIQATKFETFLRAKRPAALIINGNAMTMQRHSAVSFVAARLVAALRDLLDASRSSPSKKRGPAIVPIHFFCGQHNPGEETWATPAGVVNSLLAQLTQYCRNTDLGGVSALGDFDNGDVREIFKRFKAVLTDGVSPGTTVVCVVDGLSSYVADRNTAKDARWLVDALMKLATRKPSAQRATFMMLLTASNTLHVPTVTETLADTDILNVPLASALPPSGGFHAMKWTFKDIM